MRKGGAAHTHPEEFMQKLGRVSVGCNRLAHTVPASFAVAARCLLSANKRTTSSGA